MKTIKSFGRSVLIAVLYATEACSKFEIETRFCQA